jgi:DNA-binding GntR family transcriptional regulator
MLPATLLTASRRHRVNGDSHSEAAYRTLKQKIVTLELPPASLLNEAELMAELGLGRTPIREALLRLAFENLVVILPRRGTIVADLNVSDLQKIFEMRLELEIYAIRLATERATPAQIAEMEQLFANSDEIISQGDPHQLMALDHQAHQLLAKAAHNEFLEETLERLYSQGLRLWYLLLHKVSRLPEAIAEHQQMIAAVKAADSQRAAEVMRAHITNFQAQLMSAL